MKRFAASVLVLMAAVLTLATGSFARPSHVPLGDPTLALIHGGNDNSLTNSAPVACELLSTQGTGAYPEGMCPYLDDGTECLRCQNTNDQTQVPNSQGGPGVTLTTRTINCNNGVGTSG